MISVGSRVVVRILLRPEQWARGAAEALNGKTGTVGERSKDGVRWLVRFDSPAPTWHAHQTPWTAGWFDQNELQEEVPLKSRTDREIRLWRELRKELKDEGLGIEEAIAGVQDTLGDVTPEEVDYLRQRYEKTQ